MDNEQLIERLGQLIDKIDNFAQYANGGGFARTLLPAMRIDALSSGISSIREEVMGIYTELGGENVWPLFDDD